ncbi:MAG: tyrosine-type recombinase/integrase [Desulfobacula sp.]|jgi:integrase|uniref:tyrosine-type recombinase/integrase n=1 Tax=Desulfobacula sp. TaxID=2593537 RepID=UPI001D3BC478|nr:tyrosine-type recombinase/integrase [Desulfobacula sp.]MBT3487781.1 tyrosine-type recombinase/integrase [Desulfobacula sp.]MBT3806648.1 tyrosine-type recombinase/integrase [Desulfobacula sp.]MBT4026546.1 tyrosine-type recombinase/integrase [Desulfobacula sp.]MBT4200806.1 tyrosine-type recombinase/integrase [Desulfobacula sp.]
MNVQNLRDNCPKLISYMETNGYSKTYVDRFKREIKKIISADSNEWSCYTDVYLEYTKTSQSPDYLRDKRTIIGAIEQFDVHGRYPDGRRRHELFERGSYPLLSSEFKFVIDLYCEVEKKRGKKKFTTVYTESHNASTFFLSLQQKGINCLGKTTEEAVLSIFMSPDETLLRSCSYKKNIAAVLKACIPYHPETCPRILAFLPALRETRKNIQYLTSKEIQKVKGVLTDGENLLTLRDKAIGMLALYTGLRGCDIAGLTLYAIDWDKDLFFIRQQKTKIPLELPLTAVVGNAIYDYLTSERPHTESRYIFVSQLKPYERLKNRSIGNVAGRIMKAAGIRQSKGDRKVFHIFRHHFATELLGNGVPQPVISRALGHTSPDSLESYLKADFPHLKECAISIEHFPVPKEVFFHE